MFQKSNLRVGLILHTARHSSLSFILTRYNSLFFDNPLNDKGLKIFRRGVNSFLLLVALKRAVGFPKSQGDLGGLALLAG